MLCSGSSVSNFLASPQVAMKVGTVEVIKEVHNYTSRIQGCGFSETSDEYPWDPGVTCEKFIGKKLYVGTCN